MQAVILAAGMGKRLKELTQDATKCMVKVNGITIIERMLSQLDQINLTRIVLVIGYKGDLLQEYIQSLPIRTPIEYVTNTVYDKTNNIYSLYLARDYLLREDTLLLESDLIFDESILQLLLNHPYPNLAVVDKYESWMDGTVVVIDEHYQIKRFLGKKDFHFEDVSSYYKTVNVYKFSKQFSSTHYVPFLEAYSKALGNNEYYEQVLKVITLLEKPEIMALPLSGQNWYEIDDIQDLDIAESIFTLDDADKVRRMEIRYGGYWRYPKMLDFCYLVNPFFPPQKMLDEIKANFTRLVVSYPSGQAVNSLLAAKSFFLRKDQVVVGNGAAELINIMMLQIEGNIGIIQPTFEEYPNRKKGECISFVPVNDTYRYTAETLMSFFDTKPITALVLINPDNPTGNFIPSEGILAMIQWAKDKKIRLIVDESFVDFSGCHQTLLDASLLMDNPHLIVIKSISKSFGVPGFRLGILASGDQMLIETLKREVSIWNINSFGEFYLQIYEKYASDYWHAMDRFESVRDDFVQALSEIQYLDIIPTKANFVMCVLRAPYTAEKLTQYLLSKHRILIKNLTSKKGIRNQCFRVSIKTPEENEQLLHALRAWPSYAADS